MTKFRAVVGAVASCVVALIGLGVAGVPAQAVDLPPYTRATPASHDFGIQKVGVQSSSVDFLVGNDYGYPLAFSASSITGPDAGDFSITANSCTSQDFGQYAYCHIYVRFTPSSPGPKSATLKVTSRNAPPAPNYIYRDMLVPLSGTGAVPEFSATPDPLAFPDQPVGTDSNEQILQVTNTGSVPLDIQSNEITGADASEFYVIYDSCGGFTVAATETCEVWVGFSPTSAGAKSAQIGFTSDAPGSPHTVPISATGTVPKVSAVQSVSFGDQVVGTTSSAKTLTIGNTGGADMEVYDVSLGGTNASSFVIDSETCTAAKIPAGSDCSVNLSFSPTTTGVRSAELKVMSDASNTPSLTVGVEGTGITATAPVEPGTGAGSENPGTTVLQAQTASQSVALPARIKRKGVTVIVPANPATNAGQAISTKVKVSPKRSPKGVMTAKVLRKKNGKVSIRTYGYKKLRVKVTLSAPALTGYFAYSAQADYYKGKRR